MLTEAPRTVRVSETGARARADPCIARKKALPYVALEVDDALKTMPLLANTGLEGVAYMLVAFAAVALSSVLMLLVSVVILVGRRTRAEGRGLVLGLADVVVGCLGWVVAVGSAGWFNLFAIGAAGIGSGLIVVGGLLMKRRGLAPPRGERLDEDTASEDTASEDTASEEAFWDQFGR